MNRAQVPAGIVGLVGDIGGTNARFGLAHISGNSVVLDHVLSLPGVRYPTLEAAAGEYLAHVAPHLPGGMLDAAVAACAGPVVDGAVSFTNVAWASTERSFGAAVGLPMVHLLNDLEAVAWATPALEPAALRRVARSGSLATPAPVLTSAGRSSRAILNAGTGCGASAFVHNDAGAVVVTGEYGHASFAPVDALEIDIWGRLQARFGRVSIERVLCGPGLLNLYRSLCEIEDTASVFDTPSAVGQAIDDPVARRAVALFCAIMGSVAGDLALAFGARGGVFLTGGVAALLLTEAFDTSFRARFEDKGRFATYLADIPTWLIRDGNVALLGAARAMAARLAAAGTAP